MVKELMARSILHYHERTFSTNWDANIYRGCEHKCRYCFAQYSHRYLNTEDFFEDIFVKINASEILTKELGKKKWKKFPVNVSGISDCYQPAEAKYRIMPKVIRSFIANRNPLVIVTKSILILRDIELIKELNNVAEVTVIISVSTLDEEKRRSIEPKAAPTIERMKMLKEFKDIGCKTVVLLMPIIPYITDDEKDLDEIFRVTKEFGLGSIIAWPLHLHGKTKSVFYSFLREHFPELISNYDLLYRNGTVSDEYSADLQRTVSDLRKKYRLYSVYEQTRPKSDKWTQQSLMGFERSQ